MYNLLIVSSEQQKSKKILNHYGNLTAQGVVQLGTEDSGSLTAQGVVQPGTEEYGSLTEQGVVQLGTEDYGSLTEQGVVQPVSGKLSYAASCLAGSPIGWF